MNTRKRIKTLLTVAAMAMIVLAGVAGAAVPVPDPTSINPATGTTWVNGDTYRIAFITSETTTAESSDISDYNALVQGLAAAAGFGEATWNVIGSTVDIDARDNTSTNVDVDGTGEAIFLVDGATVVANDYADLWDGEIQHIIDQTEQGAVLTEWPWTGTSLSGTATGALGNGGEVVQGNSASTTEWIWRVNTNDPPATEHNMYALSDPLIYGSADPTLPTIEVGEDMITWSGEPVILDPTVVNNSDPVTDLTYAWTATPDTGVLFSDPCVVAPTVTITKATANPSVVTLTLSVTLAGKEPVPRSMTIDVYDDSCKAGKSVGTVVFDSTDYNEDCLTNLADFAVLALTWLNDYTLTAPAPDTQ